MAKNEDCGASVALTVLVMENVFFAEGMKWIFKSIECVQTKILVTS